MADDRPTGSYGRCPICRQKTEQNFRPFCSKRCRDVDLGRWLGDGYAIPGSQVEADEDGDELGLGGDGGGRREGDEES